MKWMLMPLKRYADFSGRSRRKEFWMFLLFNVLVGNAWLALIVGVTLASGNSDGDPPMIFWVLYALMMIWSIALIVPMIAVHVRRFHDQDKSGWFYLLNFVPCVGGLVVLYFMIMPGTEGPNRFGDDPKALAE